MRKNEITGKQEIIKRVKITGIMSLCSIAISAIILLIISLLIEGEIYPAEAAMVSSEVVIILTTFIAGICAAKILQSKTLISSISVSLIIIIVLLTGSMLIKGRGELSISIMGGCMLAGCVAGLIGGRKKKTRHL